MARRAYSFVHNDIDTENSLIVSGSFQLSDAVLAFFIPERILFQCADPSFSQCKFLESRLIGYQGYTNGFSPAIGYLQQLAL